MIGINTKRVGKMTEKEKLEVKREVFYDLGNEMRKFGNSHDGRTLGNAFYDIGHVFLRISNRFDDMIRCLEKEGKEKPVAHKMFIEGAK